MALQNTGGRRGPPPLPHEDIYLLLHRFSTKAVRRIKYPLKCHPKGHLNLNKQVLAKQMPLRDVLLVIFLNGYLTGMRGMIQKMENRT